ncbi:MAG: tetratricopeptide repeat protein [Bdellovibrionota bacterium]|jgi:tetratricopeptide (TPR) repeat protein
MKENVLRKRTGATVSSPRNFITVGQLKMGLFLLLIVPSQFCYVQAAPQTGSTKTEDTVAVGSEIPSSHQSQKSAQLNEQGAAFAQEAKFGKAEESLREAISLDSQNLSAIFNLGSVLIQVGKLKEAVELLETHSRRAGTDAGLFARLGDAYFTQKNIQKAQNAYERALALDGTLPKIPARLGTVYSLNNSLDKAIEQYLVAIQQEPENIEYLSNLVNLYLATNEPQKAVSTAKRALQLKPSSQLYASLGAAYELQNEWENSLIAFQRAKDLGEKSADVEEKIKILRKKTQSSSS